MKFLIPIVLVCTILLYVPFHIIKKSRTSVYTSQEIGEQVTYIEKYTESIGHLLLGDIVIFNTDPPHFALVDKQVDGIIRALKVSIDSTITETRDEFWVKKAFHNDQLDFNHSSRVINPNIDDKLESGEITAVFRKRKTNFYYRPIFEGGFSLILLFVFFFGISILSYIPSKKRKIAELGVIVLGLLWMVILKSNSSAWQYSYGDWSVRLAYLGTGILFLVLSMHILYRLIKPLPNKYVREGLKFLALCFLSPLSIVLSFKLIGWIYPEITLLSIYEGAHLDKLTVWSYYYYGYTFAFANLLFFSITQYRSMNSEKQIAVASQLNTNAQLNSLQARLNPHFLYNTLNSIASLIKTDPEKAEEMTMNVSKFMRHFSNRKMEHLTSISEEVDMIKEYLDIEKIRFGETLEYSIVLAMNAKDQSIPRSLLQPLVENAVKYGYNGSTEYISIRLVIKYDQPAMNISIYDSGIDFDDALDKGYGLSSVYDKLSLLYGEAYDISFTNHPDKHISISYQTDKLRIHD